MRVFIFLNLLLFIVLLIGYIYTINHKERNTYSFMNTVHTDMMKGISILLIMWAHAGHGLGVPMLQFIAAIGVALFLFCSGYGLQKSFQKNGLHHFWRKRFVKVFLPCMIIKALELVVSKEYPFKTAFIRVLLLKDANWFVAYIFVCYVVFWSMNLLIKNNKRANIGIALCFACWFIFDSLFPADKSIPFLRARQMFAFPLGIFVADKKEQLEIYLSDFKSKIGHNGVWLGLSSVLIGCAGQLMLQQRFMKDTSTLIVNTLYLTVNFFLVFGFFWLIEQWHKFFINDILISVGKYSIEFFLLHFYFVFKLDSFWNAIIYGIELTIGVFCLSRIRMFFTKIFL